MKFMCSQIQDPFVIDDKTYTFISAENVYSLFDPEKYGLALTALHTACWKGIVCKSWIYRSAFV